MACSCLQTIYLPNRNNSLVCLLAIYLILIIRLGYGADNISTIHSLSGDETLLSPGGKFELGFYKPGKSTKYYICMWYRGLPSQTVVWVANRDSPITDKYSFELKIVGGNLVLMNESNHLAWSTNVSSSTTVNSVVALVLDDGNLVLRDESSSNDVPIWQSFDFPTNTFLPGSKIGYNKLKNTTQFLTSWKSPNDPGTGLFSLELDPIQKQFFITRNQSEHYWNSGPWNGEIFSSTPEMKLNYIYNIKYFSNDSESYFTYSLHNPSILSRIVLDVAGQIKLLTWSEDSKQWNLFWAQPRLDCNAYPLCGAFSICNQSSSLGYCQCLTGFSPFSVYDWNSGDYSGGCVRKTNMQCGDRQSFLNSSQLRLPQPAQQQRVGTASECETICSNNCSCTAYTYFIEMCEIWINELLDIKQSEDDGTTSTIYIKLASSDLPTESFSPPTRWNNKSGRRKIIGISFSTVIFVVMLSCIIAYVSYRRMTRRQESTRELGEDVRQRPVIDSMNSEKSENEGIDVPFFDFEIIRAATDDFSDENKLGIGGFGPVYKGKLSGGRQVAVKRLSSQSGQGLEEFKNEVVLIAKLQHRNLVKILGYCTKGNEKILLYEYMPNKSLDTFLFDLTRCKLLDWTKRFDVISGIARGLLYLHQDSRLRVIHRDLKTGNILLDEEMTPKISDFGLARIVGGRETEASTNRVVGTYGYMSPEYAFHGHFSIKSDVFSFGVVMLEIISGKRNTGFYQSVQALSLLGYAWNLWKEEKPLDLMDHTLVESCDYSEVLKCIIVGLLCVQEDPGDRPTMMNVVSVLSSESSDVTSLPNPKQPAFVARRHLPVTHSSSSKGKTQSNKELTISLEEGR